MIRLGHFPPPRSLFLAAGLLLAGCAALQIPTGPGEVLFQDDFSRPISGWDRYADSTYRADYAQGGYEIEVLQPNTDAWATPGLNFSDVRLEVEATKVHGPDNNLFGLLCRYQDPANFYFFVASSDGYVGIGVAKGGRRRLLSSESLLPSPAVLTGQATNYLGAECIGYDLRFFVNGVPVAEARAAEWPQGDVGLIAGTYDEPGTRIRFDNFSVLRP